ncbi:MAG: hypothetical protein ACYSVY_05745 [Planctomycetota bacterium]
MEQPPKLTPLARAIKATLVDSGYLDHLPERFKTWASMFGSPTGSRNRSGGRRSVDGPPQIGAVRWRR